MAETNDKKITPVSEITTETPGYKKFKKAITESNELVTIILRTHLLSEYYIDQLIMANVARGDSLIEDTRTTYNYKIKLIKSMSIVGASQLFLLDSASGLNVVRNNCSHTLEYAISEDDIDKIGRPQGKEYLKNKLELGDDLKGLLVRTLMRLIAGLDGIVSYCIDPSAVKS